MKMLIIFCSVLIVFNGFTNAQNPCKTPDQKDGICISLQQCTHIFSIVRNYKDSTQEEIDYARKSQCASVGRTPWVCCGESPVIFKESDFPPPGQCGTELKVKIVNGEETSITDYPWMALIEYKNNGESPRFLCGGSIINKDYILTAAHCIKGRRLVQLGWKPTSVRLGEHDLRTDPDYEDKEHAPPVINVDVAETIVHEAYDPNSPAQFNDIALIRLAHSIQFNDFVKPVCLPFTSNSSTDGYDNVHLSVAGFGRTENGTSSDVKMKAEVSGFSWNRCNNLYGGRLASTQICAGGANDGKDSCSGDSGGPLMQDIKISIALPITYLVGIVSRGPQICGTPGLPGIYTRVDKYLYWIRSHMK